MFFYLKYINCQFLKSLLQHFYSQGYFLFGRDVMAIPCLRDSALAGFAAAFGVGITHFLFTSHGIKSFRYGQLAFIGVTFPYA